MAVPGVAVPGVWCTRSRQYQEYGSTRSMAVPGGGSTRSIVPGVWQYQEYGSTRSMVVPGVWQYQEYEINCGHPGYLSNGWLDNIDQGTAMGASIIFRCYPNMTIEGDQSTVCQADGSWSKPLPLCLVPHGSIIDVQCDKNYELAYSLAPSLCYNGTWTNYPRCQPARCKKLPDRPRHGMVIAPKTDHGKMARYRCKDGYQLQGTLNTTCEYGNWTGTTPSCQEVYCPFPGELMHGRVLLVGNMGMYDYRSYVKKVRNNRQLRFACNRGFYLVEGPPGATCVHGRWSPKEMPRCKPDLHPRFRWLKRSVNATDFAQAYNMTTKGDNHILDDGAEEKIASGAETTGDTEEGEEGATESTLGGEEEEDMEEDGIEETTDENVFEDPIINEDERTKMKDRVTITSTTTPSTLSPRPDYILLQATTLSFNDDPDGRNKPRGLYKLAPSRSETPPPPPPPPPRAPSGEKNPAGLGKRLRGPLIDFYRLLRTENTPHEGHKIEIGGWPSLKRVPRSVLEKEKKDKKRKRRNKWKKKGKRDSPAVPHCEPIPSEPYLRVEVIRKGRDSNYTYSAGARIKVTCLHGYGLNIGNRTAKCARRGKWKPMKPECVTLPCTVSEALHGHFEFNGVAVRERAIISHGEVGKFSCQKGYTVLGSDTMRCWYGSWAVTGKNPECIPSGDITDMGLSSNLRKSCSPPIVVPGSQGYKGEEPLDERDQKFPDGTFVTFSCRTNNIGEKNSWNMSCVDGSWQGLRSPTTCGADGADEEENFGNKSCTWRKSEPNVVTFYNDQEVTEEVSRCFDIGKYSLIGSTRRRCIDGQWSGDKPACFGLNQENDYSLDKPPTILFRNENGPMAQSNEGKMVVYPGTVLHLECLFMRKYGTPKWNVSLASSTLGGKNRRRNKLKKGKGLGKTKTLGGLVPYPNSWANAPGRNMQLEYRLSIYKAQEKDSGSYACVTPPGHKHVVQVEIKVVVFSCVPGSSLVGAQQIKCLPSGNWSAPIPRCENIECPDVRLNVSRSGPRLTMIGRGVGGRVLFTCPRGHSLKGADQAVCQESGEWSTPPPTCKEDKCISPAPPLNGILTDEGPFHAGDVVEVKCSPNYMMEGQPLIVCQEDGQWSDEVPKCLLACTYPGTIISGTMSSIKFYYPINDNITYTCSSGFVLRGARSIVCREGGRWSAPVPTCLPRPRAAK
ncbi:Locomotion-related protein Hikaru genki-like 2 [Homarus americanus]|uniref:Locomotion-related protein Hikaru genki-like 2 n=1 Tax=Homarus americanus TaxID=6706 RepID=A0A8J5TK94_HOMAM|nr:Locomotion-related protein Hikaru genki-like 2 [Homarus americanus]